MAPGTAPPARWGSGSVVGAAAWALTHMNVTRTRAAADVKEYFQPRRRSRTPRASKQESNANERRSEGMHANAPSGREAATPFDAGAQAARPHRAIREHPF